MRKSTKGEEPLFKALASVPARKSLGQYVYENLKKAIVKGQLPAGSRIVESRVASALGISRTPVREAIHKLEKEGLLSQNPSGGFFVMGLSRSEIEETFGIRSVLESYAARLAALKHTEADLVPLEEKIREYERALEKGDTEALAKINTAFHDLLYGLSRSPRLIRMISGLRDQIFRYRQVILKIEDMAKTSNQDHRLMLERIRQRDAEGVERIVREHILRGQDVVLGTLESQDGEDKGSPARPRKG